MIPFQEVTPTPILLLTSSAWSRLLQIINVNRRTERSLVLAKTSSNEFNIKLDITTILSIILTLPAIKLQHYTDTHTHTYTKPCHEAALTASNSSASLLSLTHWKTSTTFINIFPYVKESAIFPAARYEPKAAIGDGGGWVLPQPASAEPVWQLKVFLLLFAFDDCNFMRLKDEIYYNIRL